MIRQLSLACTQNGEIGYDGELLFRSSQDMKRFVEFTQGTVLIAGANTAQEMLTGGFKPSAVRPMVVVSGSSRLFPGQSYVHVASSMASAIELADALAEEAGLLGLTVIGGRQVYEHVLVTHKMAFDRVYLATAEMTPFLDQSKVITLGRPAKDIEGLACYGMGGKIVNRISETASVKTQGTTLMIPMQFSLIHNSETLDPRGIAQIGRIVQIATGNSLIRLPLGSIESWFTRNAVPSCLVVTTKSGKELEIRPLGGSQGVAYLAYLLNREAIFYSVS